MSFDEIHNECKQNLLETIKEYTKFPHNGLVIILESFEDEHGREAIIDLWGWYCWCVDRGMKDHQIFNRIAHDIARDVIILRTKGFGVQQWQEGYITYKYSERGKLLE